VVFLGKFGVFWVTEPWGGIIQGFVVFWGKMLFADVCFCIMWSFGVFWVFLGFRVFGWVEWVFGFGVLLVGVFV